MSESFSIGPLVVGHLFYSQLSQVHCPHSSSHSHFLHTIRSDTIHTKSNDQSEQMSVPLRCVAFVLYRVSVQSLFVFPLPPTSLISPTQSPNKKKPLACLPQKSTTPTNAALSVHVRPRPSRSELPICPPLTNDQVPSSWWVPKCCDKSLLVGTYKHGCENYRPMRNDPALCYFGHIGADAEPPTASCSIM